MLELRSYVLVRIIFIEHKYVLGQVFVCWEILRNANKSLNDLFSFSWNLQENAIVNNAL